MSAGGFCFRSKKVLYMEILERFCEKVDRRTACKTHSWLPKDYRSGCDLKDNPVRSRVERD